MVILAAAGCLSTCLVCLSPTLDHPPIHHNALLMPPPLHRLLPRPAAKYKSRALDLALTHTRRPSALKPSPPSCNYSSPVTNAPVAPHTPVAGHAGLLHRRHALPGGRSCSQLPSHSSKLGLLCRCYLRPLLRIISHMCIVI